jgi:protein-tyrosine phosphatase
MNGITELRPNLYVTNAETVQDLPADNQFDEVVTLGYMDIFGNTVPDASTTGDQHKFRDGPHDYQDFAAAANHVIDSLERGDSVLVHCQAGVSRSPTICCTALAVTEGKTAEDALEEVEDLHPKTNPEPRVWESAIQFVEENSD